MKAKEVILCIDDEPIILRLMKGQLEPMFGDRFDIRYAEDAEHAHEIINEIRAQKIPLVMAIVDQLLPGQLGHEFLSEISEHYPNLIKILFSGKNDFEAAIKAINEAQIFRYLIKPWKQEDFLHIIERGLQQYYIQESMELQLAELHHRVKNNLTIITCLLELQSGEVLDTKGKAYFRESINRINSIAKVHELIYNSDDMTSVDFNEYLNRIIPAIKGSEKNLQTSVSVNIDVPEYALKVNQAIPLGLIFNELITNSFKSAFTGRKEGTISIEMTADWNRLYFVYEDDGVGFKNGLNFDTAENLGLTLIRLQLSQLECTYNIDTANRFRLEFSFDALKVKKLDDSLSLLSPEIFPVPIFNGTTKRPPKVSGF